MKRASAILIHGTRQMKRWRVKALAMAGFCHPHDILSRSNTRKSPAIWAFYRVWAAFCNIVPSSVKEHAAESGHYGFISLNGLDEVCMARLFLPFRKTQFLIFLGLCLSLPLGETVLIPSNAQAQTFIENILKRDARKAQTRKKQPIAKKQTRAFQPKRKKPATAAKPAQVPASSATAPLPIPMAIPVPEPKPEPPKPAQETPAQETRDKIEEIPAPTKTEPREKDAEKQPAKENDKTDQQPVEKEASQPTKDARIYQVACPALISGDVEGKLLPPIEDGEQCGTRSPVLLNAIGKDEKLKFANPVTTNCAMAVTLAQWSNEVKKAAREIYGPDIKISAITTGSDYQCRRVNGASTGRVSEHAFANALDIMAFTFSDGAKTELASGWQGADKEKAFWRAVHAASCKMFMTVIGPDGDAAHKTNMHLDQGCHGKSCLTRICQ